MNNIQSNPAWYLVLNFIKAQLFEQFNTRHTESWLVTNPDNNPLDINQWLYTVVLPWLLEHKYVCLYLQMDDTDHPVIDIEKATSHQDLLENIYPTDDFDGDITEGSSCTTDINGTLYTIAFVLD